ncbi:MAG TPA: HAD-IC family P-type ATPase, partial [Humisphaera sp.]|nr:HAD-IC family P-type ATPase [Humisphaera sp.]
MTQILASSPPRQYQEPEAPRARKRSLFDPEIVMPAIVESFKKLSPTHMLKNPVMFVTEVGALVTTVELFFAHAHGESVPFVLQISLWLWFTVIFANFAEAMAEGRGKAQADALRKSRTKSSARKYDAASKTERTVSAESLRKGDLFVCEANDLIPADGEIIEGAATVNESAITGESAPVIREAGGDRSAVTGGTTVLSDRIVVQVTANPGESFMDRMIELIEGASRQKTPNEIALNILLAALTIIFLVVIITLKPFFLYTATYISDSAKIDLMHASSITVLVSLLVCLIPTTIGGLLSAIGIAGIDRMVQHNVLAMSGRAVEAAGDVDVLLLDKTGTITLGNRQATE